MTARSSQGHSCLSEAGNKFEVWTEGEQRGQWIWRWKSLDDSFLCSLGCERCHVHSHVGINLFLPCPSHPYKTYSSPLISCPVLFVFPRCMFRRVRLRIYLPWMCVRSHSIALIPVSSWDVQGPKSLMKAWSETLSMFLCPGTWKACLAWNKMYQLWHFCFPFWRVSPVHIISTVPHGSKHRKGLFIIRLEHRYSI